ncbi:MAG: class I SAM-dependent methyltransferase [Nannocystaceae bacterium]
MLTLVPPDIERYVADHSTAESPLFAALRERTYAELTAPQMQVGPVEGALLRMLVALTGARAVLEIGTFSGYSALSMAEALPDDGTLVTCDIDPVATAVARDFFARSPHGHKIELRLGPALETIAALAAAARRFDLVFIDADKTNYPAYYDAVWELLPRGGLIVADNTLWSGRVLAPQDDDDRAIVRFNARVHADPRVDHVLLSVRDGVMLARKR